MRLDLISYNNNNKLYLHDYKYIQYCKTVKLNYSETYNIR